MLYYLFQYLDSAFDIPGAGVFQYISFRAASAVILSLIISMIFGGRIIRLLQRLQVGETIRDLGLKGQMEKAGTPSMGGFIILSAVFVPTLLFARLDNIYIVLMLVTIVWMGAIGFIDDYVKIFRKDKKGLAGKFKVLGQVGLGLIIGVTLFFNDDVVVRQELNGAFSDIRAPVTTIPFVKNHEFNYAWLVSFLGEGYHQWAWVVFIPITVLIITAVSNGANITDGLDGLATGTSAIIVATLGVLAWVSGNFIFSDYLNIMYIPDSGELVVFSAAFIGACIGFLWYNAYPAQVFMGDTGSLAIGGIIAALAIMVRKELLIPVLCGIFLIENLSVIMQVTWFRYTKKKYGAGRRIFKMAPLHHHYQKLGFNEAKIVSRFWIIGIMLAVMTIATLKLR